MAEVKTNYISIKERKNLGIFFNEPPLKRDVVSLSIPQVFIEEYPDGSSLLNFENYSFMNSKEYKKLVVSLRNLKEEEVKAIVRNYKMMIPSEITKNPEKHEKILLELENNLDNIISKNKKVKKAFKEFINRFPNLQNLPILRRLLVYDWKEFGLLSFLLRDNLIEEIYISSASDKKGEFTIYLDHREYSKTATNLTFTSEIELVSFLRESGAFLNRIPSESKPLVNSKIPIGRGGRIQITYEPSALGTLAYANIRLFPSSPFNIVKLSHDFKSLSTFIIPYFISMFETKGNCVVCGETGSGKTTLLNALLGLAPLNLRTIIVEETPEIILEGFPYLVKIVATENAPLEDIISASLRQTPQIYILGEIRTREEISGYLRTTSAGQANLSIATFHAGSVEGFIERLKKEADASIPQIKTIDVIVFQNKLNVRRNGKDFVLRKMTGVYENLRDMDPELFEKIKKAIKEKYSISEKEVLDYLKKELELLGSLNIEIPLSKNENLKENYIVMDKIAVKILNVGGEIIYYLKILEYDILNDKFRIYLGSLRYSNIIRNFMKKLKINDFTKFLNVYLGIVSKFKELETRGVSNRNFLEFINIYQKIRKNIIK